MEAIIVPIDFSFYAESAFQTALGLASLRRTEIYCVNVVTSDLDWHDLPLKERKKYREIIDLEEEARDKLSAFIKDRTSHASVTPVVEVGLPADVIVSLADKHHAGLIVIGAYGKGHQEGRYIGSNLQKVIRMARCPVLAVKNAVKATAWKTMAFAGLFNEESRPAFEKMTPLINLTGAIVHFLYIQTPENIKNLDKVRQQMQSYAAGHEGIDIRYTIFAYPEPEKGIIQFCENQDIGWIGIATKTRRVSSTYRIGVTETVIFKTDIPVLSVKFESA